MPNPSDTPDHSTAPAALEAGRRRAAVSDAEQARREQWGKTWGKITSDAGKQTREAA